LTIDFFQNRRYIITIKFPKWKKGVKQMYEDLRKIRTERGIRLKECADVIGVQEACYCKKELGDLKFSLEEAKALAEFFKLPVEVLFLKRNLPK
jgi:hypothetical protein